MSGTVTVYPFVLHSVAMSVFASFLGPFGGFFASGFKRAFKIKVGPFPSSHYSMFTQQGAGIYLGDGALDLWSKYQGFYPWQEWWENLLLQSELSGLTGI